MLHHTVALSARDHFAIFLGRFAARASRLTGHGSGGMIGGEVAMRVAPRLLEHLARGKRIALITGTNGKTTTTRMLFQALKTQSEVASNQGGDNMTAGILNALIRCPQAPLAVLEVDEMHLQTVAQATKPAVIVLLNLSRDQLDRVGEIAVIERKIRQAVNENPQAQVVVNVDDPLMTSAAWDASQPVWVAAGKGWSGDSLTSPRTGGAIIYTSSPPKLGTETAGTEGRELADGVEPLASGSDTLVYWQSVPINTLLSLGDSRKLEANPEVFARPRPRWIWRADSFAAGDKLCAINIQSHTETEFSVNLPGRANRSNALQALVAALALGADASEAAQGISKVQNVAGRYAQLDIKGRKVRILLAKNPAGWMESLTMLNPDARLIVGINGQRADGIDLSWLWDVDFERLQGKAVIATGERAADLQVRLNYAGLETIWVSRPEDALEKVEPGAVDMLLNYTAFRDACADFRAKGWMP